MARKRSLPESLELLLDTMCNTFGGIMFIAISLVVISQLVGKRQNQEPEMVEEQQIRALEARLDAARVEVLAQQRELLRLAPPSAAEKAEAAELRRRLDAAREAGLAAAAALARARDHAAAAATRRDRLRDAAEKANEELRAREAEQARQERATAAARRRLEGEVKAAKEKLAQASPRTLRFGMEEDTDLAPYIVLLQEDSLYRFGSINAPERGEVERKDDPKGDALWLLPVAGHGTPVRAADDPEMPRLFAGVDRRERFVWIVTDAESFRALAAAREYLRRERFKVRWAVDPSYSFTLVRKANYRASD